MTRAGHYRPARRLRRIPLIGKLPDADQAFPRPCYQELSTLAQVAELASELGSPERRHVVVGVTSVPAEAVPSIDIDDLTRILPPGSEVCFILTGALTFRLASLLPDRRAPYNGAIRIWMPHGSWESDRHDHPMVYDESGEYGPRALRQVAYKLRHALAKQGEEQFDPVSAYGELETSRLRLELELVKRSCAAQLLESERLGAARAGAAEAEQAERISRAITSTQRAAQRAERHSREAVERAILERDQALRQVSLAADRLSAAEHELELLRWRMRHSAPATSE